MDEPGATSLPGHPALSLPAKSTRRENRLLAALGDEFLKAAGAALEPVQLFRGVVIATANAPLDHVYFPADSFCSTVNVVGGRQIEVGMFGGDGMSATAYPNGLERVPYRAAVVIAGLAWRMSVADFESTLDACARARLIVQNYVYNFSLQVAETLSATGLFNLEQRLARWLMMCRDRLVTDNLPITHDALAAILGVKRPAITLAIHVLEGRGLIRATRALVHVRDPDGLITASGGCYMSPASPV